MMIVSAKPGMMSGIEYANATCILDNVLIAATAPSMGNIIWGGAAVVAQIAAAKAQRGILKDTSRGCAPPSAM